MIGNLKLYIYPNNEGKFVLKYSSGINDNGRSRNSFYECDFTFTIVTSADGSAKELKIGSIKKGSKNSSSGNDIRNFEFKVKDGLSSGAEEVEIYFGKQLLKHKRIRHYVIELDGGFRREVK